MGPRNGPLPGAKKLPNPLNSLCFRSIRVPKGAPFWHRFWALPLQDLINFPARPYGGILKDSLRIWQPAGLRRKRILQWARPAQRRQKKILQWAGPAGWEEKNPPTADPAAGRPGRWRIFSSRQKTLRKDFLLKSGSPECKSMHLPWLAIR